MKEYWIVYHIETGEELYPGSSDYAGAHAYQHVPDGAGMVVVPADVAHSMPRDLFALRAALLARVDEQAEQVRSRFITATPGQIGTYVLKEAAARAWLADNTAPTVMLAPEAASRGMTIAALVEEVIANAEAWTHLSGLIEGGRFAAKAAIASATTIGGIAEAEKVDWSAVLNPDG